MKTVGSVPFGADLGPKEGLPFVPLVSPCCPVRTLAALAALCALSPISASDHSDAPTADNLVRQDANLTDLHAFVDKDTLVIALSSNPAIPPAARDYRFPSDVTFEINIDHDSEVSPEDPYQMGGTIVDPTKIEEDITFRIRFDDTGAPKVRIVHRQSHGVAIPLLKFFTGLRDDPFIRGPRQGRNVAGLVIGVPLAAVAPHGRPLLIWATSKVEDFQGMYQDLVGRSLRSMMPENRIMNEMLPRQVAREMKLPPDVMILDPTRPTAYPNGRALTDDVVDLVGDPRVLSTDAPFPSVNDVPFLDTFPYLAPPHLPPP